jgi:hypothetical protein
MLPEKTGENLDLLTTAAIWFRYMEHSFSGLTPLAVLVRLK